MSATNDVQNTYRVTYRHIEIAAAAPMEDCGDGTFRLAIESPPPVRTVVSVAEGDRARAFVVVAVVEVPAEGTARGCVIREVPGDRLPITVGTEKLRDGTLGGDDQASAVAAAPDGENDEDGYGTHMAVPSPVVSEDSSESTDAESDGGADDSGTNGEAATDDGAPTEAGSSRAKKRRGRQRK